MVFSSTTFVFIFLPAFIGLYSLSPLAQKNTVALIASLLFYGWGAPHLVAYLVLACAIDFGASRLMARWDGRPRARRGLLGAAIVLNLGLLAYFKYANFFVEQLDRVLQAFGRPSVPWAAVALPIGISFFTFHRVSYLVDVYRRTTPPAGGFREYLLYVVLFPQLIAGPIIRYHEVAGDIAHRTHDLDAFFRGMLRFSVGLAKKVLLANVLGEVADRVFARAPLSLPPSHAWIGILSYSFQIYFDFSGYSDMAIGLAGLMGIRFPENFNRPYVSRSITEFWRRWHMTLSSFMRDYLYIPLGGSRGTAARTMLNLWIVFLLSGLWHGAGWTFVLWGTFHGFFLVLDKACWLKVAERIPKSLAIAWTFMVVAMGWVLFRAPNLEFAVRFAGRLWGFSPQVPAEFPVPWETLLGARAAFTLVVAAVISFFPELGRWKKSGARPPAEGRTFGRVAFQGAVALVLCLLSFAYLSNAAFNPFIYFRF